MIQIGNDKIKDIYVGSYKIKEVYYGSEKVWGEIAPVGDGYWVHKDTGVITYFGADADFITDGIMSPPSWRYDCSEVKLPSGVTGLDGSCFRDCTSLTSITIPNSVTSIGNSCFFGCTSLPSITIPNSVTSLGAGVLSNCKALTSIYSLRSTAPSLGLNPFGSSSSNYTGRNTYNQGVNRLYVPQGATGYDTGGWNNPLQRATSCGFTISYTL